MYSNRRENEDAVFLAVLAAAAPVGCSADDFSGEQQLRVSNVQQRRVSSDGTDVGENIILLFRLQVVRNTDGRNREPNAQLLPLRRVPRTHRNFKPEFRFHVQSPVRQLRHPQLGNHRSR